jgi:hypothetical protein
VSALLCPACGDVIGASGFRCSVLVRPDGSWYRAEDVRVQDGTTITMGANEVYESFGFATPTAGFYIRRPAEDRWGAVHATCYAKEESAE